MQRRVRELSALGGGHLGAGPSAMLASAARALAASTVVTLASKSLDPKLFRDAAALADSARQQELTAVGLAEREALARPQASDVDRLRAEIRGDQ